MKRNTYKRGDGKRGVQFSTKGPNGWIVTNGLWEDREALAKEHRKLVSYAFYKHGQAKGTNL